MSRRIQRAKTVSNLQQNEPLIDLTDGSIVLQFADCVRNLSMTRRSSIWTQNVQMNGEVHYQTIMQKQMDDILLFLIIIYSKEEYPEDDQQLIDKLRGFIASSPFKRLKKYIHQTYFPLNQEEFINNSTYFAAMIEDYAERILRARYDRASSCNSSKDSATSLSTKSNPFDLVQLEDKLMDLFAAKFGELESKMNKIEKDMYAIKYSLQNGDKDRESHKVSTDHIMSEIASIKKVMNHMTLKPASSTHEDIDTELYKTNKERSIKPRRRSKKLKMLRAASEDPTRNAKKKQQKKKKKKSKKRYVKQDKEKRKEVFRVWLENECDMEDYYDVFVQNGIDNLAIVQHVTITDLALLGISNNGHKVRIMQCIQKLKYEQNELDPTNIVQ
eukprot:78907_1